MIQEAVRSLLVAEVKVSQLVGNRIYGPGPSGLLPQNAAMPAVSISRLPGAAQPMHLKGRGIRPVRLQIDSWAATGDEAWKLARAVDGRLVGFAGLVDDCEINVITQAGGPGDFPEPDLGLHRVTADYFVSTAEAA